MFPSPPHRLVLSLPSLLTHKLIAHELIARLLFLQEVVSAAEFVCARPRKAIAIAGQRDLRLTESNAEKTSEWTSEWTSEADSIVTDTSDEEDTSPRPCTSDQESSDSDLANFHTSPSSLSGDGSY